MAGDRTRKLIDALAALLSGGSTYFGAKAEEEERKRREARDLAQDQRAQEYLDLQRSSVEENRRLREEATAERRRTEANAVNADVVGRGGRLAEARNYGSVEAQAPITMQGGGKRVASENIPLVTGDGQIDLDLHRILSRFRQGGDAQSLSDVASQADAERGEMATLRTAEETRGLEGKKREFEAMSPLRLQEFEAQQRISEKYEDGPAGPSPTETRAREELGIQGTADSYAEQGLTGQEIAGRLIRENPGTDPRILVGIAIEASRGARRGAGSGVGGMVSPSSPMMQQGRIQKQREWDAAAVELRKKGQDPEQVLGPRP